MKFRSCILISLRQCDSPLTSASSGEPTGSRSGVGCLLISRPDVPSAIVSLPHMLPLSSFLTSSSLFLPQVPKRVHRASSALAEKDVRPALRDKVLAVADTRPSTTHTIYPNEQSMKLGITGNSLIASHAQLDEENERHYEHAQWGESSPPSILRGLPEPEQCRERVYDGCVRDMWQ